MKVKLNTIYASPTGKTGHPGQVIEVSDDEGKQLVAGKYATEHTEAAPADEDAPKSPRRGGGGRGGRRNAAPEAGEGTSTPPPAE